jgi:hypothetical protein
MPQPVDTEEGDRAALDGACGAQDNLIVTCMTIGLILGVVLFDNAVHWMVLGVVAGFVLNWAWKRRKKAGE